MSGRVPRRVDAATKAGLLNLLDEAVDAGWPLRRGCVELDLAQRRAHRWITRRARRQLADHPPGGSPVHGLLPGEEAEILALFDEWGGTDRSHRKLAHRGSYLHRVWVSPSSVRRVLFLADKHFRPLPRPGRSVRKPFPDWVEYKPNCIWIYDTTHFTAAGMAVLIIADVVSRKWLTEIVSVEETSTQVELAFTDALDREGLLADIDARHDDGRVDVSVDDEHRPVLLAVSDNGPQMTSGSTREFMALCSIAQHFGRPGTPTDQAWIETLNGHLKAEYPHLLATRDPATLRAELAVVREHYNSVRLHQGIGYVTPNDEHEGRGEAIRKARQAGLEQSRLRRLAWRRQHRQDRPIPGPRRCWLIERESASQSQTHVNASAWGSVIGSMRGRRRILRFGEQSAQRDRQLRIGVRPRAAAAGSYRWAWPCSSPSWPGSLWSCSTRCTRRATPASRYGCRRTSRACRLVAR